MTPRSASGPLPPRGQAPEPVAAEVVDDAEVVDIGPGDVIEIPLSVDRPDGPKQYLVRLGVQNLESGKDEIVEFDIAGNPGAGAILTYGQFVRFDRAGEPSYDLSAILRFLERVMQNDGYERLIDLLDDRDYSVPMDGLAAMCAGLMERYSDRPLERPSRSQRRQSQRGGRSTGRSR
jgi:hypothetical protein